jgi:phosphatidylglycerophosphate synthase
MYEGNKIDRKFENPIDNFILDYICEPLSIICYSNNITPNTITLIGVINALVSYWFLYNYKIHYFILFFMFAYICDCLDGYLARKYNIESYFGDLFDHITDILQYILLIVILIKKYNFLKYNKLIILSICFIILMFITQGCQEKIMNQNNNSQILSNFKKICSSSIEAKINILRFFGAGTTQLYSILLSYYLWSQKIKR